MKVPLDLALLGLSAHASLQSVFMATQPNFAFKEGPNVFSPKDLVQLKRPGDGIANDAGDLVVVPFSQYDLEAKKNHKYIHITCLGAGAEPLEIQLEKGGEVFWLGNRTLAHVAEGDGGLTIHALNLQVDSDFIKQIQAPQLIGKLPNKVATNFRYSPTFGYLVFSDYVYPDGDLRAVKEKDEAWNSRGNTAYVYDETFVRHWDTWATEKQQSLFSVRLTFNSGNCWTLGEEFVNLLQGTRHSAPVEPFGGVDDFDFAGNQVIYTSKDPELPQAWHTKQNVYLVPVMGGSQPKELTSGKQGATHSPILNKQATKAAWLELSEDGYESDRAEIVIYDLPKDIRYTLTSKWDRSPDRLAFSEDGNFIYFTAGDEAKIKVFILPLPDTPPQSTTQPSLGKKYLTPVALTQSKSASGIQVLPKGRLLFSQSSLTSPNDVFMIPGLKQLEDSITYNDDPVTFEGELEQATHLTEAVLSGKNLSKGESFWFKGANDTDVQGWALKPSGWTQGQQKKYPVVLLIHGGPQGAWEDQWSNRWNPGVFAQQGYFVIMINPTGSTTFGQAFTDAIAEDWGGKPFVDMQKGWRHALDAYPEIDPDRAVAAGASWGGYAINWIQGHPEFGFNFKALISHDGVFDSNYNGYSTDELFFFNHEWGGRPWEHKSKNLSKQFSPSNFVHKWSTPQLLIHGSKDYRLPETESIAAFHALQQQGVRSRLVVFPDENHWVLNHGNSLKWHYEVFRWFDEFVGEH